VLRFPPGVARRAGGLALVGVIELVAIDAASVVSIELANGYGKTGAIVLFNYGSQVFGSISAILALSIVVSAFPVLSARTGPDFDRANAGTTRAVLLMSWLGTAVIAAIAIPSYIRARISANEASAVDSAHAVAAGEVGYSSTYPEIGYSVALSDLGYGGSPTCLATPNASCFIDAALASGAKSGYSFTYVQDTTNTPSVAYTLNADPSMRGLTGQQSYFIDQTDVIRYNSTTTASASDNPL